MEHFLLRTPILQLDVSEEFLKMAEANGFNTIGDIVAGPLFVFHTLPGSGYRMLRELSNLLHDHGLSLH